MIMDNYQALQVGVYGGRGNVIPYGAGTNYATVNALPDYIANAKMTVLEKSTGVVSACCWVFHNEGLDFVDAGRPSNIISLLDPANNFTVDILTDCVNNGSTPQFLIAFGNSVRQFTLYVSASGALGCHIGNSSIQTSTSVITTPGWKHLMISKTGNNVSFYLNKLFLETKVSSGTTLTSENLFINGSSNNPECNTAWVIFKNSTGGMVDCYDFSDPIRWNGGSTVVSCSGNVATITDGSPIGVRQKSAIDRKLLDY